MDGWVFEVPTYLYKIV